MNIYLNGQAHTTLSTHLNELIQEIQAKPPYAIAINTQFIPKSQYPHTRLKEHDQIEIVQPIVGG